MCSRAEIASAKAQPGKHICVWWFVPQIEALKGNADGSLTNIAQTRARVFPRSLHFVCRQKCQAQNQVGVHKLCPALGGKFEGKRTFLPRVAQNMQSAVYSGILGVKRDHRILRLEKTLYGLEAWMPVTYLFPSWILLAPAMITDWHKEAAKGRWFHRSSACRGSVRPEHSPQEPRASEHWAQNWKADT